MFKSIAMNRKNGFSFVELLVVITIIAVLTGIGVVTYSSTMQKSRNAKRMTDIQVIRSALEICRSQDGFYPVAIYPNLACYTSVALNNTPNDPNSTSYAYTRSSPTSYTISCPGGEAGATCLTAISNP